MMLKLRYDKQTKTMRDNSFYSTLPHLLIQDYKNKPTKRKIPNHTKKVLFILDLPEHIIFKEKYVSLFKY